MIKILNFLFLVLFLPDFIFSQEFNNGFEALTVTEGANGSKTY